MYFTYVLLLRAFSRSGPLLLKTYQETSPSSSTQKYGLAVVEREEDGTLNELKELIEVANGCPSTFDETSMFVGPQAQVSRPPIFPREAKGVVESTCTNNSHRPPRRS